VHGKQTNMTKLSIMHSLQNLQIKHSLQNLQNTAAEKYSSSVSCQLTKLTDFVQMQMNLKPKCTAVNM